MQYFSFTTTTVKSFILTSIVVALAGAALAMPQATSAYSTTAQSVTKLTDNTFLFQVTYRFNFLNRDMRTPVLATRGSAMIPAAQHLQYSLRDAAGAVLTTGASAAIVLSDAVVQDKQYFVPERTPTHFTLFSIVQLSAAEVAAGGESSLQIDQLPFTLIADDVEIAATVPAEDIGTHRTPAITW